MFWFVTCLFITQQLYNVILNSELRKHLLVLLAVSFYLLSFVNQVYLKFIPFPLGANIVLAALPLYCAGHLLRKFLIGHNGSLLLLLAVAVVCGAVVVQLSWGGLELSMKGSNYGVLGVSFVVALCWTKVILALSRLISFSAPLRTGMVALGQASLTIMFVHQVLHFRVFDPLSGAYPFLVSVIICLLSYLIHRILLLNTVTKALLLGRRQDFDLLWRKGTSV